MINDGRFTAIAPDAATPVGARVLDASGLIAYPGFIDLFSRAGVEAPAATEADERRREGDVPPLSEGPHTNFSALRAGVFAAHENAEELLDGKAESFDNARSAGFAAAVVAPPQAIFGGEAALISLSGRPLRQSLLFTQVAQVMSFEPPRDRQLRARGTYPATPLGVIAHTRQTLLDAGGTSRRSLGHGERQREAVSDVQHDADLAATGARSPRTAGDVRGGYGRGDQPGARHRRGISSLAADRRRTRSWRERR